MKIDGGLRQLFSQNLRKLHWVPIESWMTGSGIPDANFCGYGIEGWIEYKQTSGTRIKQNKTTPFQIAWHERRARAGGRTFLAVKQRETWLRIYAGRDIRKVYLGGLDAAATLYICDGGPTRWEWDRILAILTAQEK